MMTTTHVASDKSGRFLHPSAGTSLKPDALAGGKSRYITFGADKVHYMTAGEGKHTLVFVHCWAGNLGFWREQIPALASKARLILIDLPGHGRSGKRNMIYNMDYFAAAVRAVLCDARVKKATLIGHSMGGPVIYRVYEQAAENVAALVVIDGFLRRPRVAPGAAEQFIAQFRTPQYRERTREFFGAMFPIPGTETLRDQILSELLTTPQRVMHRSMEGMFGPRQPAWDLKEPAVPVLVINAKGSIWETDDEQYVHSLSTKTDYRVMNGVGHWLMLERPGEFNAILMDMLGKFKLIAS